MTNLKNLKLSDSFEYLKLISGLKFTSAGELPKYNTFSIAICLLQLSINLFIHLRNDIPVEQERVYVTLYFLVKCAMIILPFAYYSGTFYQWTYRRDLNRRQREIQSFLYRNNDAQEEKRNLKSIRKWRNCCSLVIIGLVLMTLASVFFNGTHSLNIQDVLRVVNLIYLRNLYNVVFYEALIYYHSVELQFNSYFKIINSSRNKFRKDSVDMAPWNLPLRIKKVDKSAARVNVNYI